MRFLLSSLLFYSILISCNEKKLEREKPVSIDEIIIPSIEKKKSNVNFKLKNGVLFFNDKAYSGIIKDFYPDKNLKTTSEYYKGKRHGFFFGFYANGQKWFERYYTGGLKKGTHKGWFQEGQRMFQYHFNNKGVYNGTVKDWHLNGILGKHFNFVEGKESGSQKTWDLRGKIRANFYTVNGERHGLIGLKKCVSVLHKKTE